MKAAAFGLVRAESIDEVVAALAEHGDEARVIAGGQSLGPLMALRLAAPEVLVDLARVPALAALTVDGSLLRVGAMVRQRTVELDPGTASAAPLLAEAVPHIGHTAIRNQGTVCGSLAHADPAAELPAVALAAGATMHLRSVAGARSVAAADFFTGYYSTAVGADEVLEAVSFPAPAPRTGTAFVEFSRRHGDFALVGVAASVTLATDGTIIAANVVLTGVAITPWSATAATALLVGAAPAAGDTAPAASARPAAGDVGSSGSGRDAGVSSVVDGLGVRPDGGDGSGAWPAAGDVGSSGSGRGAGVSSVVDTWGVRPEAGDGGSSGSGRGVAGLSVVDGSGVRPEAGGREAGEGVGRGSTWSGLVGARIVRPEAGEYAQVVRAAAEAVRREVEPGSDLHATAAYRRHLAAVLTERAVCTALARALAAGGGA